VDVRLRTPSPWQAATMEFSFSFLFFFSATDLRARVDR
jgi:hypothetical protein